MRTDLCVRAVHKGEMRVDVQIREHVWAMDYPAGENRNPTPLEALLASLAACAANTLNLVLSRKMGTQMDGIEVEARAQRRAEHPTILTEVELVYRLRGHDVDAAAIERAIRIAEDQLCPVLAMLRPGTSIRSKWESVGAVSVA